MAEAARSAGAHRAILAVAQAPLRMSEAAAELVAAVSAPAAVGARPWMCEVAAEPDTFTAILAWLGRLALLRVDEATVEVAAVGSVSAVVGTPAWMHEGAAEFDTVGAVLAGLAGRVNGLHAVAAVVHRAAHGRQGRQRTELRRHVERGDLARGWPDREWPA